MDHIELFNKMIEHYEGDPKRIQHFTKVFEYCRLIGTMENIPEKEQFALETTALVHDIGIKKAEEVHGKGNCSGKLQEKLGPEIAEKMLNELGYPKDVIERVSYLVAHHHTYNDICDSDYQILVEADFLVNMYEDGLPSQNVKAAYEAVFKTESGKRICRTMFGIK